MKKKSDENTEQIFENGGTSFSQSIRNINKDLAKSSKDVFVISDSDINKMPNMLNINPDNLPLPVSEITIQEVLEQGITMDQSGSINSIDINKVKQNMESVRQIFESAKGSENKPKN